MKNVSQIINGQAISIETGRMAKQADGSILIRMGDTVLLVTAVASQKPTDLDFFPLYVEYREKLYAAGRIPGGFFKREGRPHDKETLIARLIDRPIRPLFDKNFRHEVQVTAQVLSYDGSNQPDVLGITGASAALAVSEIPFSKVISGVRIGKVNGQFIVNPPLEQIEQSELDIVVAGTDDAVLMVEGGANEVSEADFVEAIELAHDSIKRINALQRELIQGVEVPSKKVVEPPPVIEELDRAVEERYYARIKSVLRIPGKRERQNAFEAIRDEAIKEYQEAYPEEERYISAVLEEIERKEVRRMVLEEGVRIDGRGPKDIRQITCEVGVLPRAHGSALFTRGETQSLVASTLGTGQDEQMLDTIEGESWKRYMLHYNFPPFSVGEVGFFRGPGRREIGHGALAERAIKPVIPSEEDFPYTIRVVSDILESNGSSSMATVCGGSLALMDAGVPIPRAVSGIAMGLIIEDDKVEILSDILGAEDHLGDMDFKVTGTQQGITSFQMDVKVEGVTMDILKRALEQAREGRMHILGEMDKTISRPREEISVFAPKIVMLKVPVDKIREIIGPGGKVIRSIQEETGATIEVEDDGTVKVAAVDKASSDAAVKRIEEIIEEPEIGKVYDGVVKSILNFGAFVEILPGKDGLLHISEISYRRIARVEDVLKVGDVIRVKVIDINGDGKIRLSKKALEDGPPPDRGRRERDPRERNHRSSRRR
ncbi:MAG: polyribonucleotide nucleotidyltransferase [Candidatus Latescibacteria bacterium]|nr:polyribonucleotide nucleotidyltransferase [Candidatus Latescibacterota bacterium]NIO27325.1 polyribonucleotide nucleotidyltransferase [Candidatus Latescibacterota bacterium]NIO54849.1 polyribonucleotide nucleotidyltransferase [Candidatus Latescibacterota bacterium]NIT00932.1 polyribonucleotide nucleotidyltransferase [Candidatus Latescibacterota bacterium]NIT37855.1 polyribonucleotide nucleotidyltransferase [Candidatus Latescibacterota bacterium]